MVLKKTNIKHYRKYFVGTETEFSGSVDGFGHLNACLPFLPCIVPTDILFHLFKLD